MSEKEKLKTEFDKMTAKMNTYGEKKEKYVEALAFSADAKYLEDGNPENLENSIKENAEYIDSLIEEYKNYSVDVIDKAAKSFENAVKNFSNDSLEEAKAKLISEKEKHIAEKKEKEESLEKSKQYIELLKSNKESIKKEIETEKKNLDTFEKCYTEFKEDELFFGDLRKNTGYDVKTGSFNDVEFKDEHYKDCKELLENLSSKSKLDNIRNSFISKLANNPVYISGKADRTVKEKLEIYEAEVETGNRDSSITDDERTLLSDFVKYRKEFASSLPSGKTVADITTVSGLFGQINEYSALTAIRASEILENGRNDNTVIGGEKFTNGDHLVEIEKRFGGSEGIKERYEKAKEALADADFNEVSVGMYIRTKRDNISRKEAYISEDAVKNVNGVDYYLNEDLAEKIKNEENEIKEIEKKIKSNNEYIESKKKEIDILNKKRNENIKKRELAIEEKNSLEKRSSSFEKVYNGFLNVKFAYSDMVSDSLYINDRSSYASYKEKIENGVKKEIVDSAEGLFAEKDIKTKKSNSREFNTMISSLEDIKNLKDEKGNVNISSSELCEKLKKLGEDAQKYIDAKKRQVFVLGTSRRKFRLCYAESLVRYSKNMLDEYKGVEKSKEALDRKFEKSCDDKENNFWLVPSNKESVFENHIKPVASYANIIGSLASDKEKTDFVKGNVVSEPHFDYQKAIQIQKNYANSKETEQNGLEIKNGEVLPENK